MTVVPFRNIPASFRNIVAQRLTNGVTLLAFLLVVTTMLALLSYSACRNVSTPSKPKSTAPASNAYDPVNPDLTAAPVDLTTIGAVGPMPEAGHKIFEHPQAANISPNKLSAEQMTHEILMLQTRIAALEKTP